LPPGTCASIFSIADCAAALNDLEEMSQHINQYENRNWHADYPGDNVFSHNAKAFHLFVERAFYAF